MRSIWFWTVLVSMVAAGTHAAKPNPERNAYFGDLHVHTRYSFDAYIFNVRADPDDAYRYARGAPLKHAFGYPIRLRGAPLDFMAVTDHATYMGVLDAMGDEDHRLSKTPIAQELISADPAIVLAAFRRVAQAIITGEADPALQHTDVIREAWQREIAAAERHNKPGEFTTFIAYEYTSNPPFNLHRNVVFRGSKAPVQPFAATDSNNPEDLWDWMDKNREAGMEALAIPHNSNWSNGLMFQRTQYAGEPLDRAYAEQRMRNEPIVEITQVKGTSDTHPLLSPNDEWADFEIFADSPAANALGGEEPTEIHIKGSYVRDALLTGLELEDNEGFNPYRFGLIGASDTHNAGAPYEEAHFYSKTGINDGLPQRRGSVPPDGIDTWDAYEALPADQKPAPYLVEWGASGLAGVWAEENTRESLYTALRRKETFATTGTRVRVRFFAGYGFGELDLEDPNVVMHLYKEGVPMGGDLIAKRRDTPQFLAWAARDAQSAWLQRLQIIKGWIEDGEPKEAVYDMACSDGLEPDPATARCPDNGASVDLSTCAFDIDKGDTELRAVWQDPNFDPTQRAFYYVRVLENPTCRWSTWDALRAGIEPRPDVHKTIQERAWSSPIWLVPR
ncbi:MAG: DUF3604 domain-containing protein [Gammaproteobacteria bacterium]|nr:DUF3604 domain-containing protein [Gammaproteobacteria bacterium]